MNLAPFFATQFFDDDGNPLAGGLLYTYESGTTTPQTTYQDEAGSATNANPIVLDSAGRCNLWLDPALEYTLLLKTAAEVTVDSWDNVSGAAVGNAIVTSVNTLTGAVVLTADDIGFTTGTSTTWFSGVDVGAALDSVIGRIEAIESSGGITAATVSIADSGGYYSGSNVEAALQEIGADLASLSGTTGLPSQASHSGKFLTTNGTVASWANVSLPAFTVSISGGNLSAGAVASGAVTYGQRTATPSGGTSPFKYQWVLTFGQTSGTLYISAGAHTSTATFVGSNDGAMNTGYVTCFVTDADGRVTSAQITVSADHAAGA